MELRVPGQELERAAAEVASDAGRTLVGAIRRRLDAWSARASAKDEAIAREIKLDIANKGKIARDRERAEAKRLSELESIDHRRALQVRAIGRTMSEIDESQKAVEYVALKAVNLVEADPENSIASEIDDDWLARFFKYVAQVDEQNVLDVLARALANASIGRPKIPAQALDALRFFDQDSYEMFKFSARLLTLFEVVPEYALQRLAERKGIIFDATRLIDLGMITEQSRRTISFSLGEIRCSIGYGPASKAMLNLNRLTFAGLSIASLFSPEQRDLVQINTGAGIPVGKAWELQNAVGIDRDDVDILARAIIQQLCDAWPIISTFHVVGSSAEANSLEFQRDTLEQPFAYQLLKPVPGVSKENRALYERFIEHFEEFDRNELPVLIDRSAGT